jgi:pimeloyl-ACP methyl ester carboxylesterase
VGIPLDGNEIYARLWSLINGEWFIEDASYPTVLSTSPPDPEAECLERGWTKLSFAVGEATRELLWRGPEGAWARGAIVALHGGGGFSALWCSSSALTAEMLEFTESAAERGFAVFALNSLADGFTDPWGRECGKRFDFTSPAEVNVDLPYIEEVLLHTIPALRPSGSNEKVFVTGISGGGFMTVRAATHFDGTIAAFAPIAAGDPYGTYIFCDEQENDVNPGGYLDNETNLPIRTLDACSAEEYPHEREWESENPAQRPPFMQLHHLDDGLVDSSCMEKVGELLRERGYPDRGAFLLGDGMSRSDEAHFWQPEYGPGILSFFESVADE